MDAIEWKEAIEALKETSDIENAIFTMKDLNEYMKIHTHAQLIKEVENTIYDFCMEHGYCPDCAKELVPCEWEEPREYHGSTTYEKCYANKCPECCESY